MFSTRPGDSLSAGFHGTHVSCALRPPAPLLLVGSSDRMPTARPARELDALFGRESRRGLAQRLMPDRKPALFGRSLVEVDAGGPHLPRALRGAPWWWGVAASAASGSHFGGSEGSMGEREQPWYSQHCSPLRGGERFG